MHEKRWTSPQFITPTESAGREKGGINMDYLMLIPEVLDRWHYNSDAKCVKMNELYLGGECDKIQRVVYEGAR